VENGGVARRFGPSVGGDNGAGRALAATSKRGMSERVLPNFANQSFAGGKGRQKLSSWLALGGQKEKNCEFEKGQKKIRSRKLRFVPGPTAAKEKSLP